MKWNFLFLILFILFILLSINPVFACFSRGNNNPPCAEYYKSDAVFVGIIKEIDKSKIRISVVESFAGSESEEIDIYDSAACGFGEFKIDKKYLIYAKKGILIPKGELGVSGYSKIIEFPKAEKDVAELRSFLNQANSSIYGWSFVYDNKNLLTTQITISNTEKSYELKSNGSGNFNIAGLIPGRYTIKAEIPAGFKDNYGEEPKKEFSFDLRKGECARFDFGARKKKKFWF